MKTFLDIIKDVANEPWSGIDNEPNSLFDVEKTTISAINRAHSFIWNLYDFPFKTMSEEIITTATESKYQSASGNIISLKLGANKLSYVSDPDTLDFSVAPSQPNKFFIEYSPSARSIVLYPTPEAVYNLSLKYETFMSVKAFDGALKSVFSEAQDTLNLPSDIEELYLSCLKAKAVYYILQDNTDESFAPYEQAFKDAYLNLINSSGVKTASRIVI